MPSFKTGSTKVVGFDKDTFREIDEIWMPVNADRVSLYEPGDSPNLGPNGVSRFLNDDRGARLCLVVDGKRRISIAGVSYGIGLNRGVASIPGSAARVDAYRYGTDRTTVFGLPVVDSIVNIAPARRSLTDGEARLLNDYVGYPVEIEARFVANEGAVSGNTFSPFYNDAVSSAGPTSIFKDQSFGWYWLKSPGRDPRWVVSSGVPLLDEDSSRFGGRTWRGGVLEGDSMGCPIFIRGWIGGLVRSGGRDVCKIVDINGDRLVWPSELTASSIDDRKVFSHENVPFDSSITFVAFSELTEKASVDAAMPDWASYKSWYSEYDGFPDDEFGGRNVSDIMRSLSHNYVFLRQDTNSATNAIGSITVITNPNRIDSDGVRQPQTSPKNATKGKIEVVVSLRGLSRPDYTSASFKARVLSSTIEPEEIDALTGFVVENSRHELELEVSSRHSAGMGDTIAPINRPDFPQFDIEGRRFYLSRLEETSNESIILTLVSRLD